LGAALELELFWILDEQQNEAIDVARKLGIPAKRCQHWLELLRIMGYIDLTSDGYVPSSATRETILSTYSKETWSLLAQEACERQPSVQDLSVNMRKQASTWAVQDLSQPDYVAQMRDDFERARRFTRMLYEIHQSFSEELARSLDMTGVSRLMDIGGGSGVMSFALLKQHPELTVTVIDLDNVCTAGREIAREISLEMRITYCPGDFVHDELPKGFDMVLECDVGVYSEALFRKLRESLNPDGRIVIVDQLAREGSASPPKRSFQPGYAFLASLGNPDFSPTTVTDVTDQLTRAGFHLISEDTASDDMIIIQARKQ
jgi:SAM-dependent methyltransferase